MIIDWGKLLPALVLLLPPIALFHGSRVHYRALMRDWRGYWGPTFKLALHTIDLGRGALGAWWLAEAVLLEPGAQGLMRYAPFLLQGVIFVSATALQTSFCKEEDAAHAPFAFCAGMVGGFFPPMIAAMALVLAIVVSAGARVPAIFFPMLAAGVAAIGLLFGGQDLKFPVVAAVPALLLPWLLTLLFPRHFVSSYRAPKKGRANPS